MIPTLWAAPTHASGLEATLDRYEMTVPMDPPTVVQVTLSNKGSTSIYLTGVKVVLSEGAVGDVYNPDLIHEKLQKLEAGQTWDGPLVVVRANHRGPLWVKGSIHLTGGSRPDSADLLASIPLQLNIDDPRREPDGSYDRWTVPACDRSLDHCCDPSETSCLQFSDRCIYVADGYDRQQVCVNGQAEKSYEHIVDLRVSTAGAHIAYLGSFQCQSGGPEERCKRVVVIDHVEQPGSEVATHLELSPDGRHYAYIGRQSCFMLMGEEKCTGASHPIVDGAKVDALPAWYHKGG
jgi:hypothetical protein